MIDIGEIGNHYGGLIIKQVDNRFYWAVENFDSPESKWEEIPKYLFDALLKFEKERK